MPRVHHVKKARKDNPVCKRGESYYWWQFRYGGKHFSLTYPHPSQLTQSEFLSQFYSFQETFEDLGEPSTKEEIEGLADDLENLGDEIRTLGEEQNEKLDNMPEQLQDGDIGELLRERSDTCESLADALESASGDLKQLVEDLGDEPEDPEAIIEPDDDGEGQSWNDKQDEACSEAWDNVSSISFDCE